MAPLSTTSHDTTAADPQVRPPDGPPAPHPQDVPHPVFAFDLDEITYECGHPTVTGAEVMAAGGIPLTEGIIRVLPDGSREAVAPDTVVPLGTGAQFKRRPRFKRG
ncbi:hypothetical protein AO501_29125 [Mycobacterium gordonae]|uniref:Multi-ubiquitin domain-containing protein n=1 Tax=Mycobacterium gordonae TaxID=1778 RepID=A0A0Q2U6A0_MYCGO|nr:hypothetical protein [Mycobacterium gordonae]KQH76288.1 hypothetical protein AO501_29125 [Mycobacterium gordonae]